jgi:hypothetical protein
MQLVDSLIGITKVSVVSHLISNSQDDLELCLIDAINRRLTKQVLQLISYSDLPWNYLTADGEDLGSLALQMDNNELYMLLVEEGIVN